MNSKLGWRDGVYSNVLYICMYILGPASLCPRIATLLYFFKVINVSNFD
jgi:hypothetical protein